MNSTNTFAVRWNIPDTEWNKAREALAANRTWSAYDLQARPRYYLLNGDVDIRYDDAHLFGEVDRIVNLSVLDLGLALASGHLERRFLPGETFYYDQLDDDRRITFVTNARDVTISSTDREYNLTVPGSAFQQGLDTFLRELVSAIENKVPGMMNWRTARSLKRFAASIGRGT